MLKSLVNRLVCPTCRNASPSLAVHTFDEGTEGHIKNGIVRCLQCDSVYPIEDELLEFVPSSLINAEDLRQFAERFRQKLDALSITLNAPTAAPGDHVAAQLKQRQHFDWYADNKHQTYHAYAKTPFWTAVDQLTFQQWKPQIQERGWLLDVGCANGRASFSLVGHRETRIVGFDISKKLVRQAIERSKVEGAHASTSFLVGDGNDLPFANESFEHAMTYGVLHHLPDPGVSTRKIVDILKPGGIFFGSENNQTIFRSLFDLSMKLKPLWIEEAGAEPLISRSMLEDWTTDLPATLRCQSVVFLPPHLFNLVGHGLAASLLSASDAAAGYLPILRHHGGLIVFEIHKDRFTSPTLELVEQKELSETIRRCG